MKTIFFTIITIGFNFNLNAQSTFEYLRINPSDEITTCIIDDDENNIYFPVVNFQNALILKLDCNGVILDSVQIINQLGSCNLSNIIRLNNEQFMAFGEWSTDSTSQMWIVKFNNDLDILLNSKLNSNNCNIDVFRSIINSKGNLVLLAHYSSPESSINVCIYEITQNGTVIRNRFFDYTSFNIGYTLLEDYFDHSYKIFSLKPLDSRSMCILSILDTNFNITDTRSLYDYIDGHNSAKWLSYSTYFLTGERYSDFSEEMDVGILKLNGDDSVLSSLYIGKADTVDSPGQTNSLDFISENNIFFCGTTNSYSWPFQYDPSWIMVNLLDSDLNLKTQQIYGGDAFYTVYSVLATQDSGCVIACSRFDYLTQYNEFDVYILKLNKDGLLVSTPENPAVTQNVCSIYPNPGTDIINIKATMDELKIQIYNSSGLLFNSSVLREENNMIQTVSWPSGIYFYRIINNQNKLIQTGKWIKIL